MPAVTLWQRLLTPYRAADWDECIRVVRATVDADPFALTPRQLLAGLYTQAGNQRLALLQYEKLLPLAVGRGDLLRGLAVQRHIDALSPKEAHLPGRYEAMQRWFRLVSRSLGIPADPTGAAGFTPAGLIALPAEAFEHLAHTMGLEQLSLDPSETPVEGGCVRVVVMGRVRWSLALPNAAFGEPVVAAEGRSIHVDPDLVKQATLRLEGELPSECLRFDAALVRELASWSPRLSASAGPDLVMERDHPVLPTKPLKLEDIDRAPAAPREPQASAPPRIGTGDALLPPPEALATPEWMDVGEIELPAEGGAPAPPARDPEDAPRERTLELESLEPGGGPRRRARPVVEAPKSLEMGDGLVVPPVRDPFAPPPDEPLGTPIERRRDLRVNVTLGGRVALIGLGGIAGFEATVADLSISGLGLVLDSASTASLLRAFEGGAIRIDLELPPDRHARTLAGRVRFVEPPEPGGATRVGVEFVLLTDHDREAIERAMLAAESHPPLAA